MGKGEKAQEAADHRTMEWFVLGKSFKSHLAQSPCSEQGHLQLHQVAQSPIQPYLEGFQGMGHVPTLCTT